MQTKSTKHNFILKSILGLMAIAILLTPAVSMAGSLGDTAPDLQISDWVKGDAVTLEEGKVYVIEFWATWCPPCRQSIPHLTEVQKKFKDKATLIGISSEDTATVKPFVKKMADKMDYTVAVDKARGSSKAYMEEFGVQGIPHAFIINKKKQIVWHGHPMEPAFEKTLEAVVKGEFDIEEAAKEAKRMEEQGKLANEYFGKVLAKEKEEARKIGDKMLAEYADDGDFLNKVAWVILKNEQLPDDLRDKELALKMAQTATKTSKDDNAGFLDTLAVALFANGKIDEAITTEKKAIKAASDNPEMKKVLEATLAEFEKAAKKD
jgi:thiol-disulfide isomerase/thioredoxin